MAACILVGNSCMDGKMTFEFVNLVYFTEQWAIVRKKLEYFCSALVYSNVLRVTSIDYFWKVVGISSVGHHMI